MSEFSYLAGLFSGLAIKLTMTTEQICLAWKEATKSFSGFYRAWESYERKERVRKYQGLWLI